jgi:metal-dependent amidase/aminoacylase/carboxypeptidase family protein
MAIGILFPDVEIDLPALLRSVLADTYVGRDYAERPVVVTIRRQGGIRRNKVTETARVGVNVYAPSDKEANDLALRVRALIETLADTGSFGAVSTEGITEIKDENKARRYFVANIDLRGAPVA